MTIIIDECLPKRMREFFGFAQCWTVPQMGLGGSSDAELLEQLDEKGVDVFVTIDGNIEYQQRFADRKFGTIVLRSPSNRFEDLMRFKTQLIEAAKQITAGQVVHIPT